MALLVVCSVRDTAVNAFIRPFYVPAVGAAIRGFSDEVNRDGSDMGKHPEDYELFELGIFDEEAGRFTMLDEPRRLGRGQDYKLAKE